MSQERVVTLEEHPFVAASRFPIYTKPIERLFNAIRHNIKAEHHGLDVYGRGRDGKTLAAYFLCRQNTWLKAPVATARVVVPKGTTPTDRAFYGKLCAGMGYRCALRTTGDDRREIFINALLDRCGAAGSRMIILFLDEAQRILPGEMDYLVDIDNSLSEEDIFLFIVFVRQSDTHGPSVRQSLPNFPSHIKGRFFMESHRFTGLDGKRDVVHALSRYDRAAVWPKDSGISFTQHFAPVAWANGWTLASQADEILAAVAAARADAKLGPAADWPMKTFAGMVRHLLVEVASKDPSFAGFTDRQIRAALRASGYVTLEHVRSNLLVDSVDA